MPREYVAIMAITWLPAPHIPAAALLFGYLLSSDGSDVWAALCYRLVSDYVSPFTIGSRLINFSPDVNQFTRLDRFLSDDREHRRIAPPTVGIAHRTRGDWYP
jgi:hypothetical protein